MSESRPIYQWNNTPHVVQVTGQLPVAADDEPGDMLGARDTEVLVTALRLYHGDLVDMGASVSTLEHLSTLCERISRPGRLWVTQEEGTA